MHSLNDLTLDRQVRQVSRPDAPTFAASRHWARFLKLKLITAALLAAGFSARTQALPFLDASDDFLPSYTGAKDADLDAFTHSRIQTFAQSL